MSESDQAAGGQSANEESAAAARSLKCLGQLNKNLQTLLNSTDKHSAELHNRVAQLRSALDQLKGSVNSIEDIDRSAEDQRAKIVDLQRQIAVKNEFFKQTKETVSGIGGATADGNGGGNQQQQTVGATGTTTGGGGGAVQRE